MGPESPSPYPQVPATCPCYLLPVLLVYIRSYLISVTSLQFWIPIIRILYLPQQKSEEPWLFFEAKRELQAKSLGSTVKSNFSSVQKGMSKGTFFVSLHQTLYLKAYVSFIVASDINIVVLHSVFLHWCVAQGPTHTQWIVAFPL